MISPNLRGKTFGRLRVLYRYRMRTGLIHWLCLCTCGNTSKVDTHSLTTGNTKSCGCLKRETSMLQGFKNTIHGMSFTPEIIAYRNALYRCTRPNHHAYKNYGGRGIEFRFTSFHQFYAELGPRPSSDMVLDRIDNNGHYESGNVRWTDRRTSARNRRQPIYI